MTNKCRKALIITAATAIGSIAVKTWYQNQAASNDAEQKRHKLKRHAYNAVMMDRIDKEMEELEL